MKHSVLKTFIFLLALLFILPACTNTGADSEYISGARRRSQKETELVSGIASTVYTVPGMEYVKVKVDAEYAKDKYMDLYYPPNFNFEKKLPAVVVFNGFVGLNAKNMGRMIDWERLSALTEWLE